MASCLYECLCEAELEKYYPHFAAVGLQKIDELAKVSMKDYAKLGVHNMNDRKRLFQLIRIVKIMQEEEEVAEANKQHLKTSGLCPQPQVTRSGPRRQLHFDSLFEKKNGMVKERELKSYAVRDLLNEPVTCTQTKLDCPATYSSTAMAPLLGDAEVPIVQRVTHTSGYNYGVPHSWIRPNAAEKETPWTENDKIRVCVRKRPLGLREERRGEVNILSVEDRETLLLHEKKEAVDLTQYILQHVFYFDEVFGEACTNQDVYMKTAHPLIQHIFNGGNATCFAYGQTGAGKTYTMIGTHQNPGLYALAAKDIFRQLNTSSQPRRDLRVLISFYEIYCGQLYDLLNRRKRLFAREDSKHVVQIVGLREVHVDTVGLLLEVILKGGKERSTGATGVNSDSSRSHAIIQIQIKDSANRTFGRISFIDLAGSERAADARDSDRQTKMEGAEINQSLLALKECIRALDQEHDHTPFRQSKLTQVLKDSFIGNSKTCMIANVSPSHIATEHTLNTLRYADRVKELKKGIKCCTPVPNRRQTAGSASPKRLQTSPSVPIGEKSSPKKVKLGLQHPTTPPLSYARTKTFHPPGGPLSSTPKGVSKGHGYKGNPAHPSPGKGVLRTGHRGKKKSEQLTPPSGRNHVVKDFAAKTAATLETRRENSQGDQYLPDKLTARCLKVQTVQPVQKQLIPRDDFSSGDLSRSSDASQDYGSGFVRQCTEAWTHLSPHQEEREHHLRLYHQQFQQPPILQQKLSYQPLERFLAQYKSHEVRVKQDPSPQTLACSQRKDGLQLEDLDDSDFSEDSFSPLSDQGKVEGQNASKCIPPSFFLHQREGGTEEEKKIQDRQDLFCKHRTQHHELDSSWDYDQGSALPRPEETLQDGDSSKTQTDWSTETDSSEGSSASGSTLEKPYCLQEDLLCTRKNTKDSPVEHKQCKSKDKYLAYPEESFSCLEKTRQSPQVLHVSDAGTTEGRENSLPHGERERSTQDGHAALAGNTDGSSPAKETEPCGASDTSGMMAPLSMSLLNGEKVEAGLLLRNKTSPAGSLPELGEPVCHWDRKSPPQRSLQAESKSCHTPKARSSGGESSFLNTHQSPVSLSDLGDASPFRARENDDALFLSHLQGGEYRDNRQYDADREDTMVSFLSCAGEPSVDPGDGNETMAQGIRANTPSKDSVARASLWNRARLKTIFSLVCDRQAVIQAHWKQLDEMAALCFEEESLIVQMPEVDFKDFVNKLDGILLLKSKCIESMRAQLQCCLAPPGPDPAVQRTAPH
uniref:Kinesin-like protein KIF24 n=1 Tax=Sphenodon punctatus TaxID=8508 RepID=A0A8D0GUR2_SPHPU